MDGERREGAVYGFQWRNCVLGPVQLCLKLYSLGIVLLIVCVFEGKRLASLVVRQVESAVNCLLSTVLFVLVLVHELVLSLRKYVHDGLHPSSENRHFFLPANIRYSQLHSLFWLSDHHQKIRISDDFQSFEILDPPVCHGLFANHDLGLQQASDIEPTKGSNGGISLSFVSSPGISKVKQLNNKYKQKWRNRPHWWKIDTSTTDQYDADQFPVYEDNEEPITDETLLNNTNDAEITSLENIDDNGEQVQHEDEALAASSPDLQYSQPLSSTEITPTRKFHTQGSSKLHKKLRMAVGSNYKQTIWNGYAKNAKNLTLLQPPQE